MNFSEKRIWRIWAYFVNTQVNIKVNTDLTI
jgi:hypothetical protein